MDWTAFAAVASVLGTIGLGVLTFLRGTKADQALNTATNVQSTFTAQKELVDNLQEEVARHREDLHQHRGLLFRCEEESRSCRSNLAGARMIISAQEAEIENLKAVVAEHEQTIAKHEKALAAVSRRQDMKPTQENNEERRQ